MTVLGVDVSHYQPYFAPGPGVDFVIVKASEGYTVQNPYHDDQVARARAASRIVGHYHWLWPLSVSPLDKQLSNFATHAKPLPGDLLAVDWENPAAKGLVPAQDVEAFTRALKARFPRNRVVVYTYPFYEPFRQAQGKLYLGDGLWIADYRLTGPTDIFNLPYVMHQYTDKPIDQDRAQFPDVQSMINWLTFTEEDDMPLTDAEITRIARATVALATKDRKFLEAVAAAVIQTDNLVPNHVTSDAKTNPYMTLGNSIDWIARKVKGQH